MPLSRYSADQVGICISTLFANPREIGPAELEKALRLGAGMGFREIGLGPGHAQVMGLERLGELLRELGARARVIEASIAWTEGPAAARDEVGQLLELASALGADTLLAATIAPQLDPGLAVQGIAAACDLAARQGVRIAIEFIPGTAVPDLATAWRLARDSGAGNAGVILDTLHWQHQPGGPDFDCLRAIPATRIHGIQLCDSPPGAAPTGMDYLQFATQSRLLPGEGVVDIRAVLEALDGMGVADAYLACETYNTALASQGMENMVRRLRETTDALFAA